MRAALRSVLSYLGLVDDGEPDPPQPWWRIAGEWIVWAFIIFGGIFGGRWWVIALGIVVVPLVALRAWRWLDAEVAEMAPPADERPRQP